MPDSLSLLSALLSSLETDQAGGPALTLNIRLTPSEEVQSLKEQVQTLTQQIDTLKAQANRAEFLYRCETLINLEITDYCKEQGIILPRSLFKHPDFSR